MLSVLVGLCTVTYGQDVFFKRADANADGKVDISDPVYTLAYSFAGGGEPPCLRAADANDSGVVDLSDAIYTLGFIFLGTAGPPAPGLECGYDSTADDLFCGEYLPCRQPVIPFEVIDGFAVVEGDIVLGTVGEIPLEDIIGLQDGGGGGLGVTGIAPHRLWPDGVIPFTIASGFPSPQRVTDAIAHWERNTCIRFVARNNEPNFLSFIVGSDPDACFSPVGMKGGEQQLGFPAGCGVGAVIHEIGHSVGLWHEQSRCDRDSFITILTDNIIEGREHNFNKHCGDGADIGGYDYGSIMHYRATAFSKNGQPTIETIPPGISFGQSTRLSAGDIAAVGSMYCKVVTHLDLTQASGAPAAAGNPFGYIFPAIGVENVIYRGNDGHVRELWRTSGAIGHSDLNSLAGAPNALDDPMAYVFAAQGVQNVVYRGDDNHVHGLYWSTGEVGHDDLTSLANAPPATGAPFGYVFDAIGFQNVLYRGSDGNLHGLYWSTGAVGDDDLTALSGAPGPADDAFGYVFPPGNVQVALYRGSDGRLHDLYWSTGAVGHDDLTSLSGAPAPAGNGKGYYATTYGTQHAVYRGTDNHLHELYWSFGEVGHDDLTNASDTPAAVGDPAAYFASAAGTHHVVFRSGDGHLRHLSWTTAAVRHDDLTFLAGAPNAVSDPAAYLAADGTTHHVIYRSADDHLHDLSFVD